MVRHRRMGLLFSVHDHTDQARTEAIKGWLGLVGAPLLYLCGLVYALWWM